METFYSQAYRFIDHVHPLGSRRSTVEPEDLYHSQALLSLYAPSSVSSSSFFRSRTVTVKRPVSSE